MAKQYPFYQPWIKSKTSEAKTCIICKKPCGNGQQNNVARAVEVNWFRGDDVLEWAHKECVQNLS